MLVLWRRLTRGARSNQSGSSNETVALERNEVHAHRIVGDPERNRQRIHRATASTDQIQHGVSRRSERRDG
jgi:hypothetical protein